MHCRTIVLLAAWLAALSAAAQETPAAKKKSDSPTRALDQERKVVTEHQASVAGSQLQYTATTGKMAMKSDEGETKAVMFYIYYRRSDVKDGERRPLTFCFNGGPGSSSVWLHLGMLGPRRVRMPDDATPLPPPYQLSDNPHSLLDITDLVFIDPVSTGYSRPAEDEEKSQFHGYEEDLRSVGQFIHDFTTSYQRWASPKFLIGESYGGLRAAGLAGHLQDRYRLELNGVVFVSAVVDFQTLSFDNDLPYVLFMPSYAATAHYHGVLDEELQRLSVGELSRRAREFAGGAYATALLRGASLPGAERERVVAEYSRYTGLSKRYVRGADLQVTMSRFGKELLRRRGLTVGRFDSRYTGIDRDTVGERYEYDASGAAIFGPFTATLNQYVRGELKFQEGRVYEILTGNVRPWSYENFENRYVDASETLRRAMTANRHLKVFVACGYYDLATPFYAMDHTIDHLGLPAELRRNIQRHYYEGGHMMYIHEPSLRSLRKSLVKWYADAF